MKKKKIAEPPKQDDGGFEHRRNLFWDAIRTTGRTPVSNGTGEFYGSPPDPHFPGEDKAF